MLEFMYTSSYDDGRTIAIPALVDDSAERVSNDGLRYASNNKNKSKKGRQVLESIDSTPLAAIKEDSVDSSLLINAKVYVIADKYDIQPLKQLAETKYKNGLLGHWNSDSFVSSLKLLYEETPDNNRALKDFAMNAAGKHAKALLDRGKADFQPTSLLVYRSRESWSCLKILRDLGHNAAFSLNNWGHDTL